MFDNLCSSGNVMFTADFIDDPKHLVIRQLQPNTLYNYNSKLPPRSFDAVGWTTVTSMWAAKHPAPAN